MLFRRTKSLSPSEAAAAVARCELQLVDVRQAAEVAPARVAGATHIPLRELRRRLREINHEIPVAFVCRSGHRSAVATRMAADAGLDAANVKGGMIAWSRAGLPVVIDTVAA